MVLRDDILSYLDRYLRVEEFSDYGPQGLQVQGGKRVRKIVTSVSASAQLFSQAAQLEAEMIIVHHGILWDRDGFVVKGPLKQRLKILLDNEITLLAYHLPLDKHEECGNNAVAARELGLREIGGFGDEGIQGRVDLTFDEMLERVTALYKSDPLVFRFGPERIRRVGIYSGGAEHYLLRALDEGLDLFITGEAGEPTLHYAKEGRINFIAAGHYATERVGIEALGQHLGQIFDVDITFVDIPNPI